MREVEENINIFQGETPYIIGFQSLFHIFFLDLLFYDVTDFLVIIRVERSERMEMECKVALRMKMPVRKNK